MSLAEKERNRLVCWNCSSGHQRVRARFKLVWLRGRCDWLKMVLISSQGWCKACRARLNASNPVCFTENNPGTAASAPGSCAGAAFKETEGPHVYSDGARLYHMYQHWMYTLSTSMHIQAVYCTLPQQETVPNNHRAEISTKTCLNCGHRGQFNQEGSSSHSDMNIFN